jgi:hypothetical protein
MAHTQWPTKNLPSPLAHEKFFQINTQLLIVESFTQKMECTDYLVKQWCDLEHLRHSGEDRARSKAFQRYPWGEFNSLDNSLR